MQPEGTYQLIEALGSCQVGTVWSAVDNLGRSVTVAVLDPAAAADHRWREAFASTTNSLLSGEASGPNVLFADLSAEAPWAACAAGDGPGAEQIFIALGMEYYPAPFSNGADSFPAAAAADGFASPDLPAPPNQPAAPDPSIIQSPTVSLQPVSPPSIPAPADPGPVSAAPSPSSAPPAPVSGAPQPVSGAPQPVSGAPQPVSGAPQPVSGAPQSVSGVPQSPVAGPQPPTFGPLPPVNDPPQWTGWSTQRVDGPTEVSYSYDQAFPPLKATNFEPPRRRTGLWIAVAAAVVVALGAGGGIYAWQAGGGTPNATNSTSPRPVAMPTASPVSPGVEPPADGVWPGKWPKFTGVDKVQRFDLEGLGFEFTAPAAWTCVRSGNADGYVKYDCGTSPGSEAETGGELIVRNCPEPCDEDQRVAMRKAEEAWGLQWRRASRLSSYAETTQVNGAQRYGLVIVAYWRSAPDGAVDRQVVMRMTAPVQQADVLRQVANSVRVGAIF